MQISMITNRNLAHTHAYNTVYQYIILILIECTQVVVLLITGTLLVFGAWGTNEIEVKFDPFNLLPTGSYLQKYFDRQKQAWPPAKDDGTISSGR